jgi:hypothetical protein
LGERRTHYSTTLAMVLERSLRMKHALILGSNPSAVKPRKRSTLTRVDDWAKKLNITYEFGNVIEHHVDKEKLSDVEFIRVYKMINIHRNILTLGKFADSVLTKMNIVHYALPHPSPRNRQFNDPNFEEKVLQKLLVAEFLK